MSKQTLPLPKIIMLLVLLLFGGFFLAASKSPLQAQGDDWQASYWNNRFLTGDPVLQRQESNLNFNWGSGSPAPQVNRDEFSARWIRNLYLPMGHYRFTATADDGIRVWVDDTLLIDAWQGSEVYSQSGDVTLLDGDHQIKVEYYEANGEATPQLDRQLLSGYDSDWLTYYYDNMSLSGEPALIQYQPKIGFSLRGAPVGEVGADKFSILWS